MSLTVSAIPPERRGELALADERVRHSWAALDPVVNRAVNALLAMDGPVRRVAVFARNSAEAAICHLAALLAGVSSVPVSFHLTPGELVYILRNSGSTVLFVGPETAAVGTAAARAAGVPHVIGWRCEGHEGVAAWEDFLAAASDAEPPSDMPPARHLHYTSGTTGVPKAVETPPVYLPDVATVADMVAILRTRATPSPGLMVGPIYHTGQVSQIRNLLAGTGLVTMAAFDAEAVLANIERYRIANTTMVPTHFQRLLALPEAVRARYDVSSMERLAHTGAACPVDVKRRMIEWFGPVLMDAYGATEAGTTHSILSGEWLARPGSVGRAQPPYETVIVGDDDAPLGPGEVGRLYIRDTTGRGIVYDGDPEKTAAAHIAPGIFTLGEMGYVDEDGYVFITDRVSDMIVSGGVNIYPAEAEHVLLGHPKVADVAIIAIPHADMGEAAHALVIPADPADPPSGEELAAFCRARLASFKCPRSYEMVADVGRNIMGKVNKRALRAPYWPTDRTIG